VFADVMQSFPGYTIATLDCLPPATVFALYHHAGRVRRRSVADRARSIMIGMSERPHALLETLEVE